MKPFGLLVERPLAAGLALKVMEEASKSGNFSVVASRESALASRGPLERLKDRGVRCSEYGMAGTEGHARRGVGSAQYSVHGRRRGGRGSAINERTQLERQRGKDGGVYCDRNIAFLELPSVKPSDGVPWEMHR